MIALIMAGGKGSRMNYRNKALIDIFGKPMIWYVINALQRFDSIFCATNNRDTIDYLKDKNVNIILTEGKGYALDLSYSLNILNGEKVFVVPTDLPLLNTSLVDNIIKESELRRSGCISVVVRKWLIDKFNINNEFFTIKDGDVLYYTGVSIIDTTSNISEEDLLIIDDVRLALNINSENELTILKTYFKDYLTSL